jgi:hypothetical protein
LTGICYFYGMKKVFFYILAVLLVLNFAYKGVRYFTYTKVTGTVTGFEENYTISHIANKTTKSIIVAPVIKYTINGITYEDSLGKWGGFFQPDEGAKVTLLYTDDPESPELNRFFQYWLCLTDVMIIFATGVVVTAGYFTIKDKTKKS